MLIEYEWRGIRIEDRFSLGRDILACSSMNAGGCSAPNSYIIVTLATYIYRDLKLSRLLSIFNKVS